MLGPLGLGFLLLCIGLIILFLIPMILRALIIITFSWFILRYIAFWKCMILALVNNIKITFWIFIFNFSLYCSVYLVKIIFTYLIGSRQFLQNIDVVEAGWSVFIIWLFLNLKCLDITMQKLPFKMEQSIFWLPVRNCNIIASLFEDALTLFHHFTNVEISVISAKERVNRWLVQYKVECLVKVF